MSSTVHVNNAHETPESAAEGWTGDVWEVVGGSEGHRRWPGASEAETLNRVKSRFPTSPGTSP